MAAPRRTGRTRFSLFILVLSSVTLLTLDARDFGPVETLKDGLSTVISPLRSAGDGAFGPIGDAWTAITENDNLESENESLRTELAELRAREVRDQGAADELAALRAELDLSVAEELETLVAEVSGPSTSNFDRFVIEVNRGTSDGVSVGMPVMSAGGLVGIVAETGPDTAMVRLITDDDVSVGVAIVGTGEDGLLSGTGASDVLEVAQNTIAVSSEIAVGDAVVTSGVGRSLYPAGLPVGTVTAVRIEEGSLEQVLTVEPIASADRLSFVTIVLFDADAANAGAGASDE